MGTSMTEPNDDPLRVQAEANAGIAENSAMSSTADARLRRLEAGEHFDPHTRGELERDAERLEERARSAHLLAERIRSALARTAR